MKSPILEVLHRGKIIEFINDGKSHASFLADTFNRDLQTEMSFALWISRRHFRSCHYSMQHDLEPMDSSMTLLELLPIDGSVDLHSPANQLCGPRLGHSRRTSRWSDPKSRTDTTDSVDPSHASDLDDPVFSLGSSSVPAEIVAIE
jgi:hypothetical protein